MPKKKVNGNLIHKNGSHPILKEKLTFSQKAADILTNLAGSWGFILSLFVFIILWIASNVYGIIARWDIYPFILLNLILSVLAAVQAPIILMSQNRAAERDRINARYDYQVNRKAEREIQIIQKDIARIKRTLRDIKPKKK